MSDAAGFRSQVPETPEIAARFADYHPPFNDAGALTEANRCLYCFDAPCTQACPTHIDVPRFIKKIGTGNLEGSARTILDANILGASCARACPVQVLCEGACVFQYDNKQPIQIGRLLPHAVEGLKLQSLKPRPDGPLLSIGSSRMTLPVDCVVLSIGQAAHSDFLTEDSGAPPRLATEHGRIAIDRATGQTSNSRYFAGGDCTNGGREVVDAVADGKRAGVAMAVWLGGTHA